MVYGTHECIVVEAAPSGWWRVDVAEGRARRSRRRGTRGFSWAGLVESRSTSFDIVASER